MAFEVIIRKDRGIVYMRYYDYFAIADGDAAMEAYNRHPDFDPNQMHLVDFSGVTSYERNYLENAVLQAKIADVVVPEGFETLLAIFAPHPTAMILANMIRKSWDGVGWVVTRIAETERDTLAILGQSEERISDFLELA